MPRPSSLIQKPFLSGSRVIQTFFASASHAFEIASPRTVAKLRYRCLPRCSRTLSEIANVNGFLSAMFFQMKLDRLADDFTQPHRDGIADHSTNRFERVRRFRLDEFILLRE